MRLGTLVVSLLLLGGSAAGRPLAAQQPADTSLAARLERAERMIEMLRQQIAEQAAARVEPRSGHKVELSGTVLLNGFFNNAKVNSADIPTIVLPPDPPGFLPVSAFAGTARQSQIAFTLTAPNVLRGSFTGELDIDFYGGHPAFARLFPLPHLKRTRAELRWPHAWVLFGQEAPPISEVNPSTFSAVSIPGFANAGNLWFWIPQVRFGVDAGSAVRVGLEVAALAPVSTEAPVAFQPEPGVAERSRRPFGQGRLLVRWDQPRSAGEVSVGGHYGWIATTGDSLLASRGVAAAVRTTVTRFIELRGEAFYGDMLAGLGGGGIGQALGPGDRPVTALGAWGQINLRPHPELELGGGFGFDNPDDADLALSTARLSNLMIEGHLHWKPGPLVFAVEFRRVQTTYDAVGTVFVHHINLGSGFRF